MLWHYCNVATGVGSAGLMAWTMCRHSLCRCRLRLTGSVSNSESREGCARARLSGKVRWAHSSLLSSLMKVKKTILGIATPSFCVAINACLVYCCQNCRLFLACYMPYILVVIGSG